MPDTSRTILLSGCGNIGFRHLQAIAAMDDPDCHVTIIEPYRPTHERIESFLTTPEAGSRDRYTLTDRLPETRQRFDLVVIATTALHRRAVFEEIVSRHDIGCVIFEKILFQRIGDLEVVGDYLESAALPAFVNCARRGFHSYRMLAEELHGGGPVDITISGGAFGLASNAVHFLDLAEYLNDAGITGVDLSGLNPGSVPSKRADFVELFGTMTAPLDNGATLRVTCDDSDAISIVITLTQGEKVIVIDELAGSLTRNDEPGDFTLQYVSGMPYLYADALRAGDPGLTPYADAARQHHHYLVAVRDHLSLPKAADTVVPVS